LYKALKKYYDLLKHKSSLLIQIYIGKIGLRAFLFEYKVLEIAIPYYPYSNIPETIIYLVLDYYNLAI
jgi:hypothetical protein